MIIITLSGADTATCGDTVVTAKRGSVVGNTARKLIDEGADPLSMAHIMRGETLCFSPAPLKHWAKLTVSETDNISARFSRWKPFNAEVFAA